MRAVLKGDDFVLETASNGADALALVASFDPDLILMDIQLPGMNGLELTRHLKSDPKTRHILIFALTAYAMKGDDLVAGAAGCDAYITKPINTSTLPVFVKSRLEERQQS